MRNLTIRIIFLLMLTGILSGCQPRQTVLTFKSYVNNSQEAQLEIDGHTLTVPYDSVQGAVFSIKELTPGYAFFRMGSVKKMIFLQPGNDLTIQYQRPGGSSRYKFTGKGAEENNFLDAHQRSNIHFSQDMGEKEVLQTIQDSIARTCDMLEVTTLSPEFKTIERERLQYQGLCRIFTYRQWSKELVPFLKEKMQEQTALLPTEDYRNFMTNALYFVAWHEAEKDDLFHVAKSQMNYIDKHFQNPRITDLLMESVLTNYMQWRGAEQIDPLMDIFNRRVSSTELQEKIKKDYEEWSRVLKGKTIPEFTFLDIDSKEIALSSFKGKYVYIDCWATWCGPCKQQLPFLQKLEQKYKGKDIVFVSISSDSDRDKWKKMVKDQKLGGVQLIKKLPTDSDFSNLFMINAIPRFIILDKDGKVFDANTTRPSDPATTELLDSLLQ